MNLRDFLQASARKGWLIEVDKPVSPELELAAVAYALDGRPVRFNHIAGYAGWRAIAGLASSRRHFALALGCEPDQLLFKQADAFDHPRPAPVVDEAPCQEIHHRPGNLNALPILKHLPDDAGPYVTSGVLMTRDPDTGLNASYHRLLRLDDHRFAARLVDEGGSTPQVEITILQCRPQSTLEEAAVSIPPLRREDIVLETHTVVPHGKVEGIRYVIFVTPEGYYTHTGEPGRRRRIIRAIARMNAAWAELPFICVGPGRWGSANPELGVQVGYADIYNARALVELAGFHIGPAPEPSFGTHFFQDLMEARI
ncbi:MAG: hypothetical protein DSY55_00135, partial [Clostridia bacterium]